MSETMEPTNEFAGEATSEKKDRFLLSEESAEAQIEIFEGYYEIDLLEDFAATHKLLTRAIRRGRISISNADGEIQVVQHLKHTYPAIGDKLEWREISAKHKIAADAMVTKKEAESGSPMGYSRLINLAAAITNKDRDALKQLKSVDMSALEVIVTVFSNV